MNIYCLHCGEPFSITKDQLGKRGKCPHCRATIILPKSKHQSAGQAKDLKVPSRWMESSLSGMAAIFLHGLGLVLLALVPWGEFSKQTGGEGEQILIGHLSKQQLVDTPVDQLQDVAIENPLDMNRFDADSLSLLTSNQPNSETVAEMELTIGSASPAAQSLSIDSLHDGSVLAGGGEAFGKMITRLQRDGLDIVIVFDSTGSMQGEINDLKNKIQRIGEVLLKMIPRTRISICTYRDQRDAYTVKGIALTENLSEVIQFLHGINAAGGGDEPESVDEGLRWAVENNSFRPQARKVILLFGDAPPHVNRQADCERIAADFRNRQRGLVSTVTCRKDQPLPSFVSIANLGSGEAFLTQHEREIVQQLMILVFGSQHREKVLEVFELLER